VIGTASVHGDPSRPAPRWRAILSQTRMELRLLLRRPENLVVTLVIPVGVLLFFGTVDVLPTDGQDPVGELLPGVIALAVIATAFVSLGIATAYERYYGVLKRLGSSPLGRSGLVVAKVAAVAAIELVQVALLVGLAAGLGWRPDGASIPMLGLGVVLGTAAFAGLALLMAGTMRAEAVMALANAIFLVLLLLGGLIVPLDRLPEPLAAVSSALPAAALAEVLRAALGASVDAAGPMVVLAAWAAGAVAAASTLFRWD
jgi:ABC-2 type transport system permease protein